MRWLSAVHLGLGVLSGEGVDAFDSIFPGGVHDADDLTEGGVFVGAEGDFDFGVIAYGFGEF